MGVIYQTYRELSTEAMNYISNLKEEIYIPLESGKLIYMSHYTKGMPPQTKTDCATSSFYKKMLNTPFSHEQFLDYYEELINRDKYKKIFNEINASVILMGHNHLQSYGYCKDKLIINPGSCGQALDFDNRAAYTILEETASGFNVIEKRVEYDIAATIQAAKKTKIYECGTIWSELVFLSSRAGRDYFWMFFEIAYEIAASKGEKGNFYTNETWKQTYDIFVNTRL